MPNVQRMRWENPKSKAKPHWEIDRDRDREIEIERDRESKKALVKCLIDKLKIRFRP